MPARRLGPALLAAALLASCSRPPPPAVALDPAPAMCRVAPDGGPVLPQTAERGIGGTGAPVREADRGIGGTGGPLLADRGIGGTGIVAVITGFASVCLAGQEVAFDADVPVSINDRAASPAALRAGQVAVVNAASAGGRLRARAIAIRHEVSGPVEAASPGLLRVAGQDVAVTPTTWGARPAAGEWATVSGLRRPDGSIEATRLDPREPGDVLVRGRLRSDGGALHVGMLPVHAAPGLERLAGQDVTLSGTLEAGTLRTDQAVPDLLASDPAALFGGGVQTFYVETFAVIGEGRVRFGQGFSAAAPGFGPAGARRAVLALERGSGGLRAIGFGPDAARAGALLSRPAPVEREFEPAPMPNRALRLPGAGRLQGLPAQGGQDGRRAGRFAPEGARDAAGPGPGGGPGGRPSEGGRGR